MKDKRAIYLTKVVIVTFASLFMGLGISMIYKANIGSDPGGILVQAISFLTGLSVGLADILFFTSIIVVFAFITPKRINMSTLIQTFFVGTGVDLANKIVYLLPDFSLWGNIVLNILGSVVVGIAIAIYLPCAIGASPFDMVVLFICDVTHRSYKWGCYATYLLFGITGILLGGVWGVGSIIAMLVTGYVADILLHPFEKLYSHWFLKPEETPAEIPAEATQK